MVEIVFEKLFKVINEPGNLQILLLTYKFLSLVRVGRKRIPTKTCQNQKRRPPDQNHLEISRNGYLDLRCVRNNNIFNYTKFRPGSSLST